MIWSYKNELQIGLYSYTFEFAQNFELISEL
jgi:hypothetical protein